MMPRPIPIVYDEQLIGEQIDSILVGSSAWFTWLDQATSFAFRGAHGTFTARKEHSQRGGGYWRAYRKYKGKLHRVYLGKSERLTHDHLMMAAIALASPDSHKRPPRGQNHTDQFHPDRRLTQWLQTSSPKVHHQEQLPIPSFVATKLLIPSVRDTLVDRTPLMRQLDLSRTHALTAITAPAGSGKTTVLHQWCHAAIKQGQPIIWVSLDTHDNDPIRFWSYIAQAFQLASTGMADQVLGALQLPQPQLELLVTKLINALTTIPHDVTLVLDDYHVITEPAIHTSLTCLLERLPPHVHLVVASRTVLPLPMARLRTQGTLLEIQTADLSFSREESRAFFTSIKALTLTTADMDLLHQQTEGWVTGLQMAARALQTHAQPAQFIATYTGTHQHLIDYFAEEVLNQQPESLQVFMLQTAILERLTAPLCAALTDHEESGLLLEHLCRSNTFLRSLDDQGQWYQYHPLFGAFLRNRLDRILPAERTRLHRMASQWFATQGLVVEAVQHALAAAAYHEVTELIVQHAPAFFQRGEMMTLLTWCNDIPAPQLHAQLPLLLVYARAAALTGQLDIVTRCLHHMDRRREQIATLPLALQQDVWSLRALRASIAGNVAEASTWIQRALEVKHHDVSLQSILFLSISACAWRHDDLTKAYRMFENIIAVNQTAQPSHLILLAHSHQAQILVQRGQLRAAVVQCHYMLDHAAIPHTYDLLAVGMAVTCLGRLCYERNELDRATAYLHQGLEYGRRWNNADLMIMSAVYLARIAQAYGDDRQARIWLYEAEQCVNGQNPSVWAVTDFTVGQVWLWVTQNNMTDAAAWADQYEICSMDNEPHRSVPEQLAFAWVRVTQGYTHTVAPLLCQLQQAAIDKGMTSQTIATSIVAALGLQSRGEVDRALDLLDEVLVLAESEGYIRSFIDAGLPLRGLLQHLIRNAAESVYIRQIVDAYDRLSRQRAQTSVHLEPLSDREHEVVQLVAQGLSNQAIAQTLVITVSTVKKHLSTIYAKMHVQNRTQAVMRAQERGLV